MLQSQFVATGVMFALGIASAAPVVGQTWDGSTNRRWSVGSNWNTNSVPAAGANVIINNGAGNQPILNVASNALTSVAISAGSLTVDNTLTAINVSVNGTGALFIGATRNVVGNVFSSDAVIDGTVTGNFTNFGTVIGRGVVTGTLSGSGDQTFVDALFNVGRLNGTNSIIRTGGQLAPQGGQAHRVNTLDRRAGILDLGEAGLTVSFDYQNAGFGSGAGFNARAGVIGANALNASSASQSLSGAGISGGGTGSPSLNLGVVRVGDVASRSVTVTNGGAETTLRGVVFGDGAPGFSLSGAESFAIAPGSNSSFTVQYVAATAGAIGPSSITIANNFDNVADQQLSVSGVVNALAAPSILQFGSELAFDAGLASYVIDLGAFEIGRVISLSDLAIANLVSGPADALSGSFDTSSSSIFSLADVFSVTGLAAGGASGPFGFLVNTSQAGSFEGRFNFLGRGTNASDPVGIPAGTALTLRATIFVPEPGTWAMMVAGFGLVGGVLRRRPERATNSA